MNDRTNYLDLDSFTDTSKLLVVKLNGTEHRQVPLSVANWLANQELVADAAKGTMTPAEEIAKLQTLVERSFPTLTPDLTSQMPLDALNGLLRFAQEAGSNDAGAPTEGNVPAAPAA